VTYAAPSCDDARHVPKIVVRPGELVTSHLGFEPREPALRSFPSGGTEPVTRRQDPVWRVEREGAFALTAVLKGSGDASYVACFEFAD
jgi:hypothetical protein